MISVCLATYNGERYIKEQLDSILPQLSVHDELVISDDSSSDKTIEIIKSYDDKRIKIIENQKFKSPVYNFENAILHANGDYIFLCDQDDIWLPDKIESMIPFFNEFDLVVSDCVVVDENLNVLNHSFFDKMHSRSGFCKNFIKNTYLGCCMAFKNEILSYVLPFPDGIAMHDIWIGLSVELNGNSFFLHKPLMLYRRHGNNASFGGGKSKYSLRHKIEYRLNFLINLLKRKIKYKLAGSIH